MQEPDRNGKTVYGKKGSYSNLNKLGAGGFKVAYNATDDQHGNEVVVVFPTTCYQWCGSRSRLPSKS